MAGMKCANEDHYRSKGGTCCDRCHAGSYMKAECDDTKATSCAPCEAGLYMATKNHLTQCHVCQVCSPNNKQKTIKECTAMKDAVCGCERGFYCSNEKCDHCQPVFSCHVGEGVKVLATRVNDTVCAPCENGTYSNVTDFHSPCRKHTSCEELGRVLKTHGTRTSDAICGDFKTRECHWMLPAGLWSGLVLTTLVLFVLICWRKKRRSYRTVATCTLPEAVVARGPVTEAPLTLDLPIPATEVISCHQDSCTTDGCALPLFKTDHHSLANGSTQDSLDSCLPITPLKVSVSFVDSSQGNGSTGYCTSNLFRSYSEPQEDEWCGT